MRPRAAALCLLLALAAAPACAPRPAPQTLPADPPAAGGEPEGEAAPAPAAAEPLPVVTVGPLWETAPRPDEGLAGLAFWPGAGQRPWLLAAAAASHRLVLFDAESGELLREVGALGERAGSFREPVAVAVGGDLAFVVERGNGRVQVLRLPGLATVGFLGEGELARPAVVAVEPAAGGWIVWVGEEEVRGAEPTGGAAAPGGAAAGGARATVHRFEVAADGSARSGRRLEIDLPSPRGGRLAALAMAAAGGGPALVAVASGGGEVVARASPARLPDRPLDVVDGALTGAEAIPCGAAGGWLVALDHGGFLVFSTDGRPRAAASLSVEGLAAPVALAVAAGPLGQTEPGTLYALGAESQVFAISGAALAAALAPPICR